MKRFTYITFIIIAAIALLAREPTPVHAQVQTSDSAAQLQGDEVVFITDTRTVKLQAFLERYNSPLAAHAEAFVAEADKNGLDWRWVAVISGVESTFGKRIPPGSYNGWGWGIPTGAQSGIGFDSWDHAIATVTKGLKERYVNRGLSTIERIGPVYAASPRWVGNVNFFLAKLDAFTPTDPQLVLTVDL